MILIIIELNYLFINYITIYLQLYSNYQKSDIKFINLFIKFFKI